MTQRDAFWSVIIEAAKKDKDIIILSADSGAPAFDKFRAERPKQWIHCGISEASMITAAAGLALSGKKVFAFAIIPFITGRVFDQIKVAIALRGLPVTIVGVGAGYSYDDGGPTHYGVEDIGIMKNLKGIEIFSPANSDNAAQIAQRCLSQPAFRYIRLDRHQISGAVESACPAGTPTILTYGAMAETAKKISGELHLGYCVLDKVYPFEGSWGCTPWIVLEEHFYTGGLGETVSSWLHDHGDQSHFLRIAIPDHYEWENGGRAHLWKRAGLDVESIAKKISDWMK